MPRARYNWPAIKQFYIVGKLDPVTGETMDYTYGELCALFNIKHASSVKRHADRGNWNKERDHKRKQNQAILQKKLEEMKAAELPDIVEMRRRLLKVALGSITTYLKELDAGTIEVKPIDAHRFSEYIIKEYHTLFGIPQIPVLPEADEPSIQINVKSMSDVYKLANGLRNGS